MGDSIRTFIAVRVNWTPALREVVAQLGDLGRAVRPVKNDHLHVTLKFLGETDRERIPSIAEILQELAQSESAFSMQIGGLGAFPNARRPSVVWAGLENAETLTRLAEELEKRLQSLGFQPEKRPFHPHLTLARIKRKPPAALGNILKDHTETDFGTADVASVELDQSELHPDGARYTVLESAELAGGEN